MDYYFDILTIIEARVAGDRATYTEVCESGLDLIRFGNNSCYAQRMS
jgi:hypothetical protein